MPLGSSFILCLGGTIIVLGFVVDYLFRKTGIADAIFLLIFGLFMGSYFRLVDPKMLMPLAPVFSQIALLIILMDGGMRINIYEALKGSFRATLLAAISFLLAMLSVAFASCYFVGWDLLYGLLFGAIVGNPTPILVFSIIKQLKLNEHTATVLKLEATIAEVLAIVFALALLNSFLTPQHLPSFIVKDVISRFSIGGMIGLIAGVLWYFVLDRLRGQEFSYMLSLAIAFIIFGLVESVGGSGPVSALLFGLALGNEENIAYILKQEKDILHFDEMMKVLHSEISFFIRTFFFVFLGILVIIPPHSIILYGALISLLLFAVRIVSVKVCTIKSPLRDDERIMRWMVPRGLAPAVLSILVLSFAGQFPEKIVKQNAEIISELVFIVIIATILICTFGTYLYSRKVSPPAPI